jgi:glutamyl-tRNA reductase
MNHDFVVLHRTGPERFRLSEESGVFSFMTCLRHIVIADIEHAADIAAQAIGENDHILRGEEAYTLILEIICGLHSPLVGETEVYGQFKNAVSAFKTPATPWGMLLAKTFKALFEDAKKIRDQHLKDLGSQSYGSVLRREVKGLRSVHILGSGHLVQEILPWINKDGISIVIHCRNPEKARETLGALSGKAKFASIEERFALSDADALVIAAPVASEWIRSWVPQDAKPRLIADLRADSGTDVLAEFSRVLQLGEFMTRLSQNQTHIQERKGAALSAVARAASDRARTVENRPFGWEDVCA